MPLNLPKLHDFIYQNIAAVIPGDLDYAIPLKIIQGKNFNSLSYKY
jgi:hypothetical protein